MPRSFSTAARRGARQLLVAAFLGSVAVTGVAAASLTRLHDRETARQKEALALTEVHLLVNSETAMEWQVRATTAFSEESRARLSAVRRDIGREMATFSPHDSAGDLRGVVDALGAYHAALDQEMELFAAGRADEGIALDEAAVDPGFDRVVEAVENVEKEALASAERLHDQVRLGILIRLIVAVTAIGAILLFVVRRQIRASRADSRRQAERAGETRLSALIRNGPDAIALTDQAGTMTYQSASFTPVLGYGAEELVGQPLAGLVHPDDAPVLQAAWVELIHHRESESSLECRILHDDGTWRPCEVGLRNLFGVPDVASMVVNLRDVSERTEAEKALRESEGQLREAQTLARLGSWRMELGTGLCKWSEETYAILGVDHDAEPTFESFLATIHPEDRAAFEEGAGRVMATGEAVAQECRIVRPDGEVRWIGTRASVLRDKTGAMSAVHGTMQDITEGKLAQDAVQESEARLREAQALAHVGNWRVEKRSRRITWSDEIYRLHDVEPGSFAPTLHDFLRHIHPDDRAGAEGHYRRLLVNGESADVEFRLIRADGEVRWIHAQSSALPSAAGVPDVLFGTFQDITDRKRIEEALSHQALHDPLTGLANRTLFRDHVEHAVNQAQRRDGIHAVLFIDLDNFKHVNDSLGHAAGDELLRVVGARLQSRLRAGDTVARLGGDEFGVLLEGTSEEAAARVADGLLETLRPPVPIDGREVVVGASIGIAIGGRDSGADQQLRDADAALYAAKAAGKGRYERFEPRMHRSALRRLELEGELRRAVDAGELGVHYQPIVDLATDEIVGAEALARWHHPWHGDISPVEFIAIAEETGLIRRLGAFVLRQACQQARQWQDRYHRNFGLTVNVSIRQLEAPGYPDEVSGCLRDTGLEPGSLTLEVTESVVMDPGGVTIAALQELKARGIKLAIDDFGTGYSSLSYLPSLPIATLKIDRSFVQEITKDGEGAAVARAVVDLAGAFKLDTVAEGVEDLRQAAALRSLGCRFAQGFWFSKPLPQEAMGLFLDERWRTPGDEPPLAA